MKTVITAITSLIALSAFAANEKADVVLERLKHPASVCVMGDPCSDNLGKAPVAAAARTGDQVYTCLLYTSPSPRDLSTSRMPSSA